jgi:hypothetical protein
MKRFYLVGVAVVIAACSTHPVRCGGALRPINKPAVSAQPGSSATTGQPNTLVKGNATTHPAAASGKSKVPPAEPRS